MATRNIYLKIEKIEDYSPVEPQTEVPPPVQYRRDCMRNPGHPGGMIPESEVEARAMTAIVYREYLDPDYLVPKPDKLVQADINEPIFHHRVPGTVIYAHPGDLLKVHVLNDDRMAHSFHIHGVVFGIESDGAWPFGTENPDGNRSDEICPGQTWTYTLKLTEESIGVWPFHDHAPGAEASINRGLFGGLVVLPKKKGKEPPYVLELPDWLERFRKDLIDPKSRRNILPKDKIKIREQVVAYREERLPRDLMAFFPEPPFPEPPFPDPKPLFPKVPKPPFLARFYPKPPFPALPKGRYLPILHVPLFFHKMQTGERKPLFDTGDIEELIGVSDWVDFPDEGSFEYFCTHHPQMQGTVEVVTGELGEAEVRIIDNAPNPLQPMNFDPQVIRVNPGGRVRWRNESTQHHTATSRAGASIPSHCFNGRAFIGNSPTIVGRTGQTIRWYVFNLDLGHEWHNFHTHSQRWTLGDETIDVRSLGPAESFMVETQVPPVLVLTPAMEAIQDPKKRPRGTHLYHLKGDFLFHCHVHHHMMNGMAGLVRAKQSVWLTDEMVEELENTVGLPLDDWTNDCPVVDPDRCKKQGPGSWEELPGDPEVTMMHAVLLPESEKVLYWGYPSQDRSRIWDAAAASYSIPANQYSDVAVDPADPNTWDLWSSEHAHLDVPEGKVLAHGGQCSTESFLFDPATLLWAATGPTVPDRFYSTTLTLPDGKILTLFGGWPARADSLEIYDPAAGTWSGLKTMPGTYWFYPWAYVIPGDRIFIAGPQQTALVLDWTQDPILVDPLLSFDSESSRVVSDWQSQKGTSTMLILRPPSYAVRVINAGGSAPGTDVTAEMIDLSDPGPAWVRIADMHEARTELTSVLLPDGRVFVAGGIGGTEGIDDGGPCEIFDPENPADGWMLGPLMQHIRTYHSSMLLLPDGSVLAGGQGSVSVTLHERYLPGYFSLARPEIDAVPLTPVHYATVFTIQTTDASDIDQVVLMKPGSVTHGFNMGQRGVECEIVGGGANSLDVQAPPSADIAPPGHYQVFILDSKRVPSVGKWIRLTHP